MKTVGAPSLPRSLPQGWDLLQSLTPAGAKRFKSQVPAARKSLTSALGNSSTTLLHMRGHHYCTPRHTNKKRPAVHAGLQAVNRSARLLVVDGLLRVRHH